MKKVLIVAPHYLPGYKGGGPIRTIANLVDWLGNEFEFHIFTADRDLGDERPYPSIEPQEWCQVNSARVRYLAPHEASWSGLKSVLQHLPRFDLVYVNSFFAPLCVKLMLLRGQFPGRPPILVAPRGEFAAGALRLKRRKKHAYLTLVRSLRLYRSVTWQATTDAEIAEIKRIFRTNNVLLAPNLPPQSVPDTQAITKESGCVSLVFISRITKIKNLDYALRVLARVDGEVQFDIFGNIEDESYWKVCQQLMTELPDNVTATYRGGIVPQDVYSVFSKYHAFFFPTWGENFGHVILEALLSGCLVLTSDQTPWRDLPTNQVGWNIPLAERKAFQDAIQELVAMGPAEFQHRTGRARDYGRRYLEDPAIVETNRQMLLRAMGE
ncbi:MAG: glycosyltransferase family 4 protein [Chloroflexi bacterium]|nr:glycosyltransferase family 4 protein [Chloroflexota bacterium]